MKYQNTFERVETKFLLNRQQKQQILWAMEPYMEPDRYGRTTILNLYFDTPDYRLIRRSLEKPVYREKLRLRSYEIPKDDSTVFIELKKKYKGVVYKRRTGAKEREAMLYLSGQRPLPGKSQITEEIDYFMNFYRELSPVMAISYEREAYFCKDFSDLRITFDENILWREEDLTLSSGAHGRPILEKEQALLEVKTAYAIPLWLTSKLSKLGVFPTGFSKYGSAYLEKMRGSGTEEREICYGRFPAKIYDRSQERKAQ